MIDWQNGGWRDTIMADDRVRGSKASIWKAGYHNGRSMLECLAVFQAVSK